MLKSKHNLANTSDQSLQPPQTIMMIRALSSSYCLAVSSACFILHLKKSHYFEIDEGLRYSGLLKTRSLFI